MTSSVNIGVFNSALPGSAAYDASLARAQAILGVTPDVVNNSVDISQPMPDWVAAFNAEAVHTAASPGGTSNIADLSLPMMSSSDSLTMLQAMDRIASGADDALWAGIVDDYKAAGFSTIYIRPGWEMNGDWYPWSVDTQAEAQAYIAAFDDIATVCRSISGITVKMVWCPDQIDNAAIPTQDMYPGDSYVDVIGEDFYDALYPYSLYDWSTGATDASLQQWWSNPVNLEHYWDYPNAVASQPDGAPNQWSLLLDLQFAAAHDKPAAVPEAGDSGNGTTTGPPTDPDFPAYLARVLLAPGAPPLAFVSIWDAIGTSSNFTDSSNPVMAAAWADFVKKIDQNDGGPSVKQPASITVAHNAITNILALLTALITPGQPGDTETISGASVVSGSVIPGSAGQVEYTAGGAGSDTITYTVTDQLGDTFNAMTAILIDGGPSINAAPLKLAYGQTVSLTALGASMVTAGLPGDTESFSNVTCASGTVRSGASGYSYTPPASGTDTLSYTVTDQVGDSLSGSTTMLVDPGPILKPGAGGATPGQALNLDYAISQLIAPGLAGDTDTVIAVTASTGSVTLGTGSIAYTAPMSGRSVLTFTVRDQLGDIATNTYTVTVAPSTIDGSVVRFDGPGDGPYGSDDAGVVVTLLTAAGSVVATQTTGRNGWYAFTLLLAGSYELAYTPPSSQVVMAGSTAATPAFSLAANTTMTETAVHFMLMASLSGQVLSAGSGQAGVTVALLGASGSVLQTLSTDSTGSFTFYGLSAGTYQVKYIAPAGTLFQVGGTVSSSGLSTAVTLAAAQAGSVAAAVLVPGLSTIAGTVHYQGAGEAGVTITLFDSSANRLGSTVSTADGSFSFGNLAVASYQLAYTAPTGLVLLTGGPANAATGLTGLIPVSPGQTTTLAPEQLSSRPGSISAIVAHIGGATDPAWGKGLAGVTVSLLDMSGDVLATTVTDAQGWYIFRQLGAGSYQVRVTAPAGAVVAPGTRAVLSPIAVATGVAVVAAKFSLMSAITMNGTGLDDVAGDGSFVVTGNAAHSMLTLGAGNQQVTLTGGADTVITGTGNSVIALSGTNNTVTVGSGNSTITAGSGQSVVHAAGGDVTITAGGADNLFDAGAGQGFLYADGSGGNVFMLNPGGAAWLNRISGFGVAAGDVLDLQRTLAGTAILPDQSNIASLVTATVSGGNTTLAAMPAGGGTVQPFAVLEGVQTTVVALQAAHDFSLT